LSDPVDREITRILELGTMPLRNWVLDSIKNAGIGLENIQPPRIKVIDIIQDLRFNIGYAFASMHSYRNGDIKTGAYEFYKSCLYGTRDLEILKLRKFPLSFTEIYKLSKKLDLKEYNSLVLNAYKLRQSKTKFEEKNIFKNITYLNEFMEPQLINYFNKKGNKILI